MLNKLVLQLISITVSFILTVTAVLGLLCQSKLSFHKYLLHKHPSIVWYVETDLYDNIVKLQNKERFYF